MVCIIAGLALHPLRKQRQASTAAATLDSSSIPFSFAGPSVSVAVPTAPDPSGFSVDAADAAEGTTGSAQGLQKRRRYLTSALRSWPRCSLSNLSARAAQAVSDGQHTPALQPAAQKHDHPTWLQVTLPTWSCRNQPQVCVSSYKCPLMSAHYYWNSSSGGCRQAQTPYIYAGPCLRAQRCEQCQRGDGVDSSPRLPAATAAQPGLSQRRQRPDEPRFLQRHGYPFRQEPHWR